MKRANHIKPFVSMLVILFFLAPLITSLIYSSLNFNRKGYEIVLMKTKNSSSSESTDNPLVSEAKEKEVEDKLSNEHNPQGDQFFIRLVSNPPPSSITQSDDNPRADSYSSESTSRVPKYIIKKTLLL